MGRENIEILEGTWGKDNQDYSQYITISRMGISPTVQTNTTIMATYHYMKGSICNYITMIESFVTNFSIYLQIFLNPDDAR